VNSKARKEARIMNISGRLVTGVMGGFLLIAAYVPAWAGPVNHATTPSTQAAAAAKEDQAILGFLGSIMLAPGQPRAQRCKPETLYSQHDVIGDPEACFGNHFDVRAGGINPGAAPAF
jgi:hypothetical protein